MRVHGKHENYDEVDDEEDVAVDFSNAILYIGALQTITATIVASAINILSCVLIPTQYVSAVRSVVLSGVVGYAAVHRPFRLGRVHGLNLIFSALRPCVGIYLGAQVAEQLVHTCARDAIAPPWRKLGFHATSIVAMVSGFMRARRPLASTDLPFLVTVAALLAMALLPPPPVILSGPLCAPPTLTLAAERVVRAFVFALVYSIFTYAAAPPVQTSKEVWICVMRASSASVWILCVHVGLLPLAAVQASLVIYKRMFGAEYRIQDYNDYGNDTYGNDTYSNTYSKSYENYIDDERVPLVAAAETTPNATPNGIPNGIPNMASNMENATPKATCVDQTGEMASAAVPTAVQTFAPSSSAPTTPTTVQADGNVIVPKFETIGARGLVDIGASSGVVDDSEINDVLASIQKEQSRSRDGFDGIDVEAVAARV